MSEFLYLYRGGMQGGSPEELQQQMQKWGAWMKELGEKGHLKSPGHPLERGGKTVSGRAKTVTDGSVKSTFASGPERASASLLASEMGRATSLRPGPLRPRC